MRQKHLSECAVAQELSPLGNTYCRGGSSTQHLLESLWCQAVCLVMSYSNKCLSGPLCVF